MDLSHRQPAALHPPAVDLAELCVAVAVWVPLHVLQVEQLEGHTGLAPLGMQDGAVGPGARPLAGNLGPPVQPACQGVLAQGLDVGPVQPGGAGRRSTPETAPNPTYRPCATSRWLRLRVHFCRRISRVCCMDSRSAAIAPLSVWERTVR